MAGHVFWSFSEFGGNKGTPTGDTAGQLRLGIWQRFNKIYDGKGNLNSFAKMSF